MTNQPISEQYRLAALEWVDLDNAARLQEECKTSVLSKMMKDLGDLPVTSAEREVKSSVAWEDYITVMVVSRTEANKAKCKLEYLRMRFSEQQSFEATARAEMKLS